MSGCQNKFVRAWRGVAACQRWVRALAMLPGLLCGVALAQPAEEPDTDRVFAAVVGVMARVPDDARTAGVLGETRLGSGIVIDSNGLIVTIGYVLLEASDVTVYPHASRPVAAKVIGYDAESGLGLLRAGEMLEVAPMRLGDSSLVEVQDKVLVVSFSVPRRVTPGFVISTDEFAGYWEYLLDQSIVTWPPHRNMAGAALVDEDGRLLGVGSLVVGEVQVGEQSFPGSMFVPIDELKRGMGSLLASGRSADPGRPWLGVYVVDHEAPGVLVTGVASEGPAEIAGVLAGDVIERVSGVQVENLPGFYRGLWGTGHAGDEVGLSIRRDGEPLELSVPSVDRYAWYRLFRE